MYNSSRVHHCPCNNPEGLLAIFFNSKNEEKICIILWHLLSDYGIKLIIYTWRCLILLNFMYFFQEFIFQSLKLMQMAPTVSHHWYYLLILAQDPKLLQWVSPAVTTVTDVDQVSTTSWRFRLIFLIPLLVPRLWADRFISWWPAS